jgi:hypothetical protein
MNPPAPVRLLDAVRRLPWLLTLVCLLGAAHPALSADTKDAKKTDAKKTDAKKETDPKKDAKGAKSDGKSAKEPVKELPIPQSSFTAYDTKTYNPKVARDPFFPKSERLYPPKPKPPVASTTGPGGKTNATATVIVKVPDKLSDELVLKGISGTPKRRFAVIGSSVKTYTFENGEQQMVRGKDIASKVKVLAIKDQSVILQIDGETGEKELKLPGGP